jgi:surfeit locus 1 family protein
MHMLGWVFRPTLWPTIGFVILSMLLLWLGNWQLNRAAEKIALITAKQHHQQAAPLMLHRAPVDPLLDRFRPVIAIGQFVPGQQWLLDNRLYQGQPGYHVFSLFQLQGAGQILVNRGWVSTGTSRQSLPSLPLPSGRIRLNGHLDTPASVGLALGKPVVNSQANLVVMPNLDIAALAAARGLQLSPLALVANADQPGVLQHDWSAIETLSPNKHWGYAAQWFALALALLFIYIGVNLHRKESTTHVR